MQYTIENFGLTKSPLDAWRGTGRHSKPKLSKPVAVPKPTKDVVGITIPCIPDVITLFIPGPPTPSILLVKEG